MSQKHLRLEVPNYNHDARSQTHPYSFIQLGAAPVPAEDQGYDLLEEAGLPTDKIFKDDFRHANDLQHPSTRYFRDDGLTTDSASAPQKEPTELTNELLTRGGWRQHTDGNHITTTRGDRVEVIFGNHKMVVYGRMNHPNNDWGETYWETSGGHTRWATNTQGDMVMVEWNDSRDTWRTYEEEIKGNVIDRYQGIVDEINECPTMEAYVGCRDAQVNQEIPRADSDSPHEQTTQADGWVNPATGFGGTASAADNTKGRPRPKENPDITTEIEAKKIDETVKVTSGMGAAGSDAFSDLMKPTTPAIATPSKTTTQPIADIVNAAFGEYEPSIRLPTGGWASPTIGSGWIVETQHVVTKSYELTLATLHAEKVSVDSGVTINQQTGLRPTLAPTGAVSVEGDARRINHVTDVGINIIAIAEEMYLNRKRSNYGGWTFNLSIVGFEVDISIGHTFEIPNFEKIGATGGRHQFGLTLANTLDVGFSAEADFKLCLHTKINIGKRLEVDLIEDETDLGELYATLKKNVAKITKMDTGALANALHGLKKST
jgi:hypothetical protein